MIEEFVSIVAEFMGLVEYDVTTVIALLQHEWGRIAVGAILLMGLIYVQVMRYKHKREREGGLAWYEWAWVSVLLVVGFPLNFVINLIVMSPLFVELPRKWTVSGRVDRYLTDESYHDGSFLNRWRMKWARRLARFLNKYDPGHVG